MNTDTDVDVILVPAHAGYTVPEMERLMRVRKVGVRMGRREKALIAKEEHNSATVAVTPTYAPSQILLLTTSMSTPTRYSLASTPSSSFSTPNSSASTPASLIASTLSSLIPTSLLVYAESLIEENRIEDAVAVAEEVRRGRMLDIQTQAQGTSGFSSSSAPPLSHHRLSTPNPPAVSNTNAHSPTPEDIDTSYIFQLAALLCFARARFDDAGRYFLEGGMDPRIVVWYFEEVRGAMASRGGEGGTGGRKEDEEDEIDIFAGVAGRLPKEGSVDEIGR